MFPFPLTKAPLTYSQAKLKFAESMGTTGEIISSSSQDFVDKHAFVDAGTCNTMCLQKMFGIIKGKLPREKELLEIGQWIRERPRESGARMQLLLKKEGCSLVATYKGHWLYDELYAGEFIKAPGFLFYVVIVADTLGKNSHAFLIYQVANKWALYDPNFGTGLFPQANSCLLGFKRVLNNCYDDFAPYFPVTIYRFSPW